MDMFEKLIQGSQSTEHIGPSPDYLTGWLNKQNCREINVYVAEGNDLVLGFYEKYGFKKRSVVLQKRRE